MAIKRILFPFLALAIPGAVVGGLYWSTSRKTTVEFEEQLAKARKLGLHTTLQDYRKSMPAPTENAIPLLLQASDTVDWTKTPSFFRGRLPLKDTDAAGPFLLQAGAKTQATLSFDEPEAVDLDLVKVDRALLLLFERIATYSASKDVAHAAQHLKALANLREILAESGFAPLAARANLADAFTTQAALLCAANNGPAGVIAARSVLREESPKIDHAKSWRSVAAYQLAMIDHILETARTEGLATFAPFKNADDVMQAKSETLAWSILQSTPGLRGFDKADGANIAPRVTLHLGRNDSNAGTLLYRAFQLRGAAHMPRWDFPAGEVRNWFLKACEAGGEAPVGIDKARDAKGAPLRFQRIPTGFIVYSTGKDRVDTKGAGDDPLIRFQAGRVTGKL